MPEFEHGSWGPARPTINVNKPAAKLVVSTLYLPVIYMYAK